MNRASMMMEQEREQGKMGEVEKKTEKDGPDNMDGEGPQDGGRKKRKRCGRGQPLVVFTTTTLDAPRFDSLFGTHNFFQLPT